MIYLYLFGTCFHFIYVFMIIDKYKGKIKENRLLPVLSNQKINAYLKEIADLCGIKKRLSYHTAKHNAFAI